MAALRYRSALSTIYAPRVDQGNAFHMKASVYPRLEIHVDINTLFRSFFSGFFCTLQHVGFPREFSWEIPCGHPLSHVRSCYSLELALEWISTWISTWISDPFFAWISA
jgi:hypothetical protein